MTERPILMSAPMVRAILAGTKTQTRRAIRPRPPAAVRDAGVIWSGTPSNGEWWWLDSLELDEAGVVGEPFRCPYGVACDRLWVREAWRERVPDQDGRTDDYRADYPGLTRANDPCGVPWKPSIHMPRRASRILLEVTEIRVERLQEISDSDAVAEGVGLTESAVGIPMTSPGGESLPHTIYRLLWESINGKESWAANPWVWCVSFRRLAP